MISKLERQSAAALAEPYNELARSVHEAEAVNIDETSWREDRRKAWLWVTVTALVTVFTIARNRSAAVAQAAAGDKEDQVVSSDRFKSYDWMLGVLAAGLLEPSPPRFPGDDRPGRRGRDDRPAAVAAVGPAVRGWHGAGRRAGRGCLPASESSA